uniref:Ribosomal_L18e/L15P domain-containing protein n=1 Tax=Macrostomum lignano TaxID=282301 RepID=A0A1I8F7U3_9PLAT
MLLCSLLSRLSFSTAAGPPQPLHSLPLPSCRGRQAPGRDKQTVDDIDCLTATILSLSGEVNGDMPTGADASKRILTGELLHHSRGRRRHKKLGGSALDRPGGTNEASYHGSAAAGARSYELAPHSGQPFPALSTRRLSATNRAEDRRRGRSACRRPRVEVGTRLPSIAKSAASVLHCLSRLRLLSERPDGKRIWRKFGHLAPLCLTQAIEAGVRQMTYEESVEIRIGNVDRIGPVGTGSYTVLRKNAPVWNMLHYKRPYSKLQVRIREGKPPKYYHPHTLPSQINGWLPMPRLCRAKSTAAASFANLSADVNI